MIHHRNKRLVNKKWETDKVFIIIPWEEGATVTFVFSCTTCFCVSFPIRLDCIFLGTFFTFPLLLTVLSTEVLFYTSEVSKSSRRIMVDATLLWTDVNFLLDNIFVWSLSKLPWKVVPSSVKLKILISLKTFVAYFTDESVCRHERLRRKRNDLSIWICLVKLISVTNLKIIEKKYLYTINMHLDPLGSSAAVVVLYNIYAEDPSMLKVETIYLVFLDPLSLLYNTVKYYTR